VSTPTFILLAAQVIAGALVGAAAGHLVSRWLGWRDELGGPERALLAIGGGVAFAVACMAGNIVTGGAVFGVPGIVPALAIATIYVGRTGLPVRFPRAPYDRIALGLAVVVLGALYVAPVIAAGSGVRTGDPPWHLGWTEELLGGEAVPNGPAPTYGRNSYPWGWHAVLATLVRLVPSSDPVIAHEAMHVILVGAIPLAAACLARAVRRDAGWPAAVAASAMGGFGWVAAGGHPAFDASPREARFGADLVVASPNSVYELMPPALPRELGLVLLGLTGLLLIETLARPTRRSATTVGIGLGLVGLVSVPMFVSGVVWTTVAIGLSRGGRRRTIPPAVLGVIATFGLWAAPVAANFVRYGGFVNVTPSLGQEWPLGQALASWGLLLPFALLGLVVAWRARAGGRRSILVFVAAASVVLCLSLLRGAFDWSLAGNATLLHQGRTWPPAHLLGAALAGVGAVAAWRWATERSRVAAGLGAAVVVTAGAASPMLASDAMRSILDGGHDGFIYSAPELRRDGSFRAAAGYLGPGDVVAAWDDDAAFHLFEFSGARLADYDHRRLGTNDMRIRYRDLARGWEEAKPFCWTHRLERARDLGATDPGIEIEDPRLDRAGVVLLRYPEPTCERPGD